MAGSSGSRSSLLHSFHQGRGSGGTGGWKLQITSARRIRCFKNCASFALECWAMFVSRSYRSSPKNTTCSKNSPRHTANGNRAGKVFASRAEVYKTSRNVTPDNNVSADFQTPEKQRKRRPPTPTDRPYVAQIRSLRPVYRDQPTILHRAHKKGSENRFQQSNQDERVLRHPEYRRALSCNT